MKAALFHAHGPIENLSYEEFPAPTPGPGEVLLKVRASALNHLDLFVREGLPGLTLELPHWGGCDIAGEVAMLGPGVTGWELGTHVVVNPNLWCGRCRYCLQGEQSLCVQFRVLGEHTRGGLADYTVVPAANLFRIPPDYPWAEAAAVPLVFMTAWRALVGQAKLQAGERVLILGAGGGVATAAIQIAKLLGATVWAASRSPDKRARAEALGAERTFDSNEDWGKAVWQASNKEGVEVVLENVGAATWTRSLRALAKGGRLVTFGATTGPLVEIDLRVLFWKQFHLIGSTMANSREMEAVLHEVFWRRTLHPVVDRVLPMHEIQAAHRLLEAGEQFGKIVLVNADD